MIVSAISFLAGVAFQRYVGIAAAVAYVKAQIAKRS